MRDWRKAAWRITSAVSSVDALSTTTTSHSRRVDRQSRELSAAANWRARLRVHMMTESSMRCLRAIRDDRRKLLDGTHDARARNSRRPGLVECGYLPVERIEYKVLNLEQ